MEEENFEDFDFNPAEIDFMLLTHAHIDHSGRIPKLYNEWYSKDENCQCREEVKRVLDDIYEKYPNADIESCINDYFG